jgi:hypothetical protein
VTPRVDPSASGAERWFSGGPTFPITFAYWQWVGYSTPRLPKNKDDKPTYKHQTEDTRPNWAFCKLRCSVLSDVTHLPDIKQGQEDFAAFLKEHDPAVIVYDLAPPYWENWKLLQILLNDEATKHRRFVLTTTNKRLLQEAVGLEITAFEISEKPYRLASIVNAVRNTAETALPVPNKSPD